MGWKEGEHGNILYGQLPLTPSYPSSPREPAVSIYFYAKPNQTQRYWTKYFSPLEAFIWRPLQPDSPLLAHLTQSSESKGYSVEILCLKTDNSYGSPHRPHSLPALSMSKPLGLPDKWGAPLQDSAQLQMMPHPEPSINWKSRRLNHRHPPLLLYPCNKNRVLWKWNIQRITKECLYI